MLTCAVMFISLYNKPEWYEKIVPTKLVPAVSIRGRVVWESVDILKAGTQPGCISHIIAGMLHPECRSSPSCQLNPCHAAGSRRGVSRAAAVSC